MNKAHEVIKRFNISNQTLYNWRKEGMPCEKRKTGQYEYDVEKIEEWLKDNKGR